MEDSTVYAGLVGVGLNTYWPQFSGLYERLCGYRKQIAKQLDRNTFVLWMEEWWMNPKKP